MSEFQLMTNALAFTYKALGKGKMIEYQCGLCGYVFESVRPTSCPICSAPETDVISFAQAERNREINKHDEILEDELNG